MMMCVDSGRTGFPRLRLTTEQNTAEVFQGSLGLRVAFVLADNLSIAVDDCGVISVAEGARPISS